jgi:thioredoxin-related protein
MKKITILFLVAALTLLINHSAVAEVGEDGLHKQDWFSLTFKDVAEDIQEATDEGKRLVLIFEQRGCIFCEAMHEFVLADPEINQYVRENYNVVQFNLFGDEEVTDLDGDVLTEKTAAEKWGIAYTPFILFMPETIPEDDSDVVKAAVAALYGSMEKQEFLHQFEWIKQKGYESDEKFKNYHKRRLTATQ